MMKARRNQMKTIIIYESTHHGNTKKLVDAIVKKYGIKGMSIDEAEKIDCSVYDTIGIASGIAFGKFYKKTERFVSEKLPNGKNIFFLYTCERDNGKYAVSVSTSAEAKQCKVIGIYGCQGFDTYGPFKLIGGIAKGHPTQKEIDGAVNFYAKLK